MLTNYCLLTSLCSYTECVRKTWGEIWPESHWRLWTFCFGRLRRHKDVSDAESNFIKVHTIQQYTIFFFSIYMYTGQGWRSGESTRLPPMWPGFKSRRRRHMWVEFVVGSLPCSNKGFSGTPVFPSPQKPTIPNSNSTWNARTRLNEFGHMNS